MQLGLWNHLVPCFDGNKWLNTPSFPTSTSSGILAHVKASKRYQRRSGQRQLDEQPWTGISRSSVRRRKSTVSTLRFRDCSRIWKTSITTLKTNAAASRSPHQLLPTRSPVIAWIDCTSMINIINTLHACLEQQASLCLCYPGRC